MNQFIKKYWLYILGYLIFFIGINVLLGYISGKNLKDFLDSNLFQTLATLSVGALGVLALVIYEKQQSDKKSDIAKLILIEIQSAEQKISRFLDLGSINEANKGYFYIISTILDTNNWTNNRHLFLGDLDQSDDIVLMDSFYGAAQMMNSALLDIHKLRQIGRYEKATQMQVLKKDIFVNLEGSDPQRLKELYEEKLLRATHIFHNEDYWFEKYEPMREFIASALAIRFVSATSTAEKLKKISKQ